MSDYFYFALFCYFVIVSFEVEKKSISVKQIEKIEKSVRKFENPTTREINKQTEYSQ